MYAYIYIYIYMIYIHCLLNCDCVSIVSPFVLPTGQPIVLPIAPFPPVHRKRQEVDHGEC